MRQLLASILRLLLTAAIALELDPQEKTEIVELISFVRTSDPHQKKPPLPTFHPDRPIENAAEDALGTRTGHVLERSSRFIIASVRT